MPRVRLMGLFLFITTIFIALAAAATKTTHINFKRPDRVVAAEQLGETTETDTEAPKVQFRAVPIVYPLVFVGAIGLLMWFVPAAVFPTQDFNRRGNKSRSRSRVRKK